MAKSLIGVALVLLSVPLASCGSGSGGEGVPSTPPPPPPPAPPPPPSPPPPSSALIPATQTASPATPVASDPARTFGNLGSTTQFPLLQTSVDATFGGVSGSQWEAVISALPGGTYRLTVSNSGLGINDIAMVPFPGTASGPPGSRDISADIDSAALSYTRYGWWMASSPVDGMYAGSAFVTGFLTPSNAIPLTGTATFSGAATGLYHEGAVCNCVTYPSTFSGNVSLTANFASASLGGSINGITIFNQSGTQLGTMNDIGFNASIDRLANLFSGTTSVLTTPGTAYSFSNLASGDIRGRFYGPTGSEIGAVFGLSEGSRRLIGSFGAKAN